MAYSTLTEAYGHFFKCLCIDTPVTLHVFLLAFVDEIIYLCGIPRDLGMSTNTTAVVVLICTSQVTLHLLTRRNELSEERWEARRVSISCLISLIFDSTTCSRALTGRRTIDSDLMSHFGAECVFYVL